MKILKVFICISVLCASYLAFASNDNDSNAEQYLESEDASLPEFNDWTAEDLRLNNSGGGSGGGYGGGGGGYGGGGGGRGWGYNPFRWSGSPRTFYNPFSWGNPPGPTTTVITAPPKGPEDDLDSQIDAANRRAKKLELLLAEQRRIKALEELNQGGGGSGSAGSGSAAP
jgi:hypothetical protein